MRVVEFAFDSRTHPYPRGFKVLRAGKILPDIVERLTFQVWYEQYNGYPVPEGKGMAYPHRKGPTQTEGSIDIRVESADPDEPFNLQILTSVKGITMESMLQDVYITRYWAVKGKIEADFQAGRYIPWEKHDDIRRILSESGPASATRKAKP